MAGLARGTVRLEAYDPAWVRAFEVERNKLQVVFGLDVPIEHIGSTAVAGLTAKPIIDIAAGISTHTDFKKYLEALGQIGYTYLPERIFPERVFMPKGPESARTHYLHLVTYGSNEWEQLIKFRDALRADPALAGRYSALKRSLEKQFASDRKAYTSAKNDFIQSVLNSQN